MRAMLIGMLGLVAFACGSSGPQAFLDTDKTTIRASLDSFTVYVVQHRDSTAAAIDINGRGDLAYVRGTYQVVYLAGATDHGKFLEVRRGGKDGRWLIIADIFNSDLPPAAPVAAPARH